MIFKIAVDVFMIATFLTNIFLYKRVSALEKYNNAVAPMQVCEKALESANLHSFSIRLDSLHIQTQALYDVLAKDAQETELVIRTIGEALQLLADDVQKLADDVQKLKERK